MSRSHFALAIRAALSIFVYTNIVTAEEGMWTYDNFPKAAVEKAYGFAPDEAWLSNARMSSLRLPNCSASFVSSEGLVMTNHHCARACLSQLSSKAHDYVANGFYADSAAAEVRCSEMEVDELLSISDVGARLSLATQGEKTGSAEFARKEQSEKSAIEKECAGGDAKLRCEVVDLYQGGLHHLYKYRRYSDVRLVFAPELAAPKFGGDPDNFEFPRWSLDTAFLRAWDEGKPVHPEHWFRWSPNGSQAGELAFVSGNPGSTKRLYTVAQYIYERDFVIPERLFDLAEMRGQLTMYAESSAENARVSNPDLLRIENSYKGLRGRLDALTDPQFLPLKIAAEEKLRAAVKKEPRLQKEAGHAWEEMAKAVEDFRLHRKEYAFVEGQSSVARNGEPAWFADARLLKYARLLVRAAGELKKPDSDRLREWGEARVPALVQQLESTAPVARRLEILKLTYGLTKLREQLGPSHPFVKKILGEKSPEELANELVTNTHLDDAAVRKQLFDGGQAAIDASTDPLISLLRAVDSDGRTLRKWFEDSIVARENAAASAIAHARFALEGTKVYPDATFTLRLSYGAVKGVSKNGVASSPFTDFASAFAHQTGRAPFLLPPSWNAAAAIPGKLDPAVHLDFASDNDIIGGNSGSPVFNQRQEIIGLIFDGNLPSLGGDYFFDESTNRAVSVDSAGIIQALDKIYGARRVIEELQPRAAKEAQR